MKERKRPAVQETKRGNGFMLRTGSTKKVGCLGQRKVTSMFAFTLEKRKH